MFSTIDRFYINNLRNRVLFLTLVIPCSLRCAEHVTDTSSHNKEVWINLTEDGPAPIVKGFLFGNQGHVLHHVASDEKENALSWMFSAKKMPSLTLNRALREVSNQGIAIISFPHFMHIDAPNFCSYRTIPSAFSAEIDAYLYQRHREVEKKHSCSTNYRNGYWQYFVEHTGIPEKVHLENPRRPGEKLHPKHAVLSEDGTICMGTWGHWEGPSTKVHLVCLWDAYNGRLIERRAIPQSAIKPAGGSLLKKMLISQRGSRVVMKSMSGPTLRHDNCSTTCFIGTYGLRKLVWRSLPFNGPIAYAQDSAGDMIVVATNQGFIVINPTLQVDSLIPWRREHNRTHLSYGYYPYSERDVSQKILPICFVSRDGSWLVGGKDNRSSNKLLSLEQMKLASVKLDTLPLEQAVFLYSMLRLHSTAMQFREIAQRNKKIMRSITLVKKKIITPQNKSPGDLHSAAMQSHAPSLLSAHTRMAMLYGNHCLIT